VLTRLIGALFRAALVMAVIVSPALLLPDASQGGLETALIFAVLAAAFTLFEYASSAPGIVNFRFAPPYNRARFLTFSLILISLIMLARATEGETRFAQDYLGFADRLAGLLDFPLSPVRLAAEFIVGTGDEALALLVRRAVALSISISIAAMAFFTLLLWVFKWPQRREKFNLWVNLPTFAPSSGRDVERRLIRGGWIYIFAGLTLPFTLTVLSSRALGWIDPQALAAYPTLVWGVTIWAFLPAALVIRGAALIKVGWLVRRARTAE